MDTPLTCRAKRYKTVSHPQVQKNLGRFRSAVVGHRLYVLTNRPYNHYWQDLVVLDTNRRIWSRVIPDRESHFEALQRVRYPAVILAGDKIYAIGGYATFAFATSAYQVWNKVFQLDLSLLEWQSVGLKGDVLDAHGVLAAFCIDSRNCIVVLDVEYDPSFVYWVDLDTKFVVRRDTRGARPERHKNVSTCCVGFKVYFLGDIAGSAATFLHVLDLAQKIPVWSQLGEHLPRSCLFHFKGRILIFGAVQRLPENREGTVACIAVAAHNGEALQDVQISGVKAHKLAETNLVVERPGRLLLFSKSAKSEAFQLVLAES